MRFELSPDEYEALINLLHDPRLRDVRFCGIDPLVLSQNLFDQVSRQHLENPREPMYDPDGGFLIRNRNRGYDRNRGIPMRFEPMNNPNWISRETSYSLDWFNQAIPKEAKETKAPAKKRRIK